MRVLVVTHSNDNESVEMVGKEIEALGGEVVRFNSDEFPVSVKLEAGYSDSGTDLYMENSEGRWNLSEIDAVWYRRLSLGGKLPGDLGEDIIRPSVEESRRLFVGLLESMDVFTMNSYHSVRYSENKLLQLKVAGELGLNVPDTVVTNSPGAVRELSGRCKDGIITKMQSSFALYRNGEEHVVFTNKVSADDMEHLNDLKYCPMIFQEKLDNIQELRVTIVGDQIFAASIDPALRRGAEVDWRKKGAELINDWKPYELPEDIKVKLLKFMDYFKINYGAMDIIVTPEGKYVFLENNPGGEFFWLDRCAGLPIAGAIASVLMDRSYRR